MPFKDAVQCGGISKHTGKRCRQPALGGSTFCRLHEATSSGDTGQLLDSPSDAAEDAKGGAPEGNANAVQHGAYSPRLLPEEEETYASKKAVFSRALDVLDAFDEQLVHLLALLAAKVDVAAAQGAKPEAIGPLINQIIQLMRELKATRASRPATPPGEGKTFADLFALLQEQQEKRKGATDSNASRDASPAPCPWPNKRACARCGGPTRHAENDRGDLVCQDCGSVAKSSNRTTAVTPGAEVEKQNEI